MSFLIFFVPVFVHGQAVAGSRKQALELPDTSGSVILSFMMGGGSGFEQHELGYTNDDKVIEISAGGGVGIGFHAGYLITHQLEVEVEVAYLTASLSQVLENAEGSFDRSLFAGNVLYRIPVSRRGKVLIGGGAGYFAGGKMDLDFSGASNIGGAHNIYDYDNAIGFQIRCIFELFGKGGRFSKHLSVGMGLQYTSVHYNLKSVSSNSVDIPLSQLPGSLKTEFGEVDGSGADLLLYVCYYL
ncbi:MAG: outer membrane beta-barrel protein [bacterium]